MQYPVFKRGAKTDYINLASGLYSYPFPSDTIKECGYAHLNKYYFYTVLCWLNKSY